MASRGVLLVVTALLALAGCFSSGLVGKRVPDFALATSTGEVVTPGSFPGKFLVVELMATWCGPCQRQVGDLKALQEQAGDRVAIVSIGIDPSADSEQDVDRFELAHRATWPHGLDRNGSIARAFGLSVIPKLVVVDPSGTVVFESSGTEVSTQTMLDLVTPRAVPTTAPPLVLALAAASVALVLGLLAPLNPYRALHRDAPGAAWTALAALAALGASLYVARGWLAAHAWLGALGLGGVALGAVAWWPRARRLSPPTARSPTAPSFAAFDRAYEAAPHLALVVALGIAAGGGLAYGAALLSFCAGYALAVVALPALPSRGRVAAGVAGLALAGAGLVVLALGAG